MVGGRLVGVDVTRTSGARGAGEGEGEGGSSKTIGKERRTENGERRTDRMRVLSLFKRKIRRRGEGIRIPSRIWGSEVWGSRGFGRGCSKVHTGSGLVSEGGRSIKEKERGRSVGSREMEKRKRMARRIRVKVIGQGL